MIIIYDGLPTDAVVPIQVTISSVLEVVLRPDLQF